METNTSLPNDTDSSIQATLSVLEYIGPVLFPVVSAVGIIGNFMLILIILRRRTMRTTPNIFIGSMALGDLLLLLVSVPFYGSIYLSQEWMHGAVLCKLTAFLKALSLGVSIFTLTALSADRYMAIMHPMRRYTDSPTKRIVAIAVSIWILSTILASLEASAFHVTESFQMLICIAHPEGLPWFPCFRASIRFLVYFAFPISVIGFLYILMARNLWRSLKSFPQPAASQGGTSRQQETRRKVAMLVLSIVVLFIICWLPLHIFFLWFHCPSAGWFNAFWYVWKLTSIALSFLNSCVNPVALYLLSDQFRKHFNHFFCCRCFRKKRSTAGQSTCIDHPNSYEMDDPTVMTSM